MARVPASRLLSGMRFEALPEGWTPLDAVVLVKCLDEDGRPTWALRTTDGVNDEELLGALMVRQEIQRLKLLNDYLGPPDEDE